MKIPIAVAASFLALGSGIAWASIPDAGDLIHGCFDGKGTLRVIDGSTSTCKNGETALSWNQIGPRGATGPQGPAGPPAAGRSVLMENVADNSTAISGDATAVDHPVTGKYVVYFGRSVEGCSATASLGDTGSSGGFVHVTATLEVGVASEFPDAVDVFMNATDTTTAFDSAFHLIVAC
jgi:hypothetical protein